MIFEIEFTVKTTPRGVKSNSLIETFTVFTDASTFGEAREKVFADLKTATSLENYLDKVATATEKGNG